MVQLEYETYTSMAMKQMMELCVQVREKWRICKVAIVHRIGYVCQLISANCIAGNVDGHE